MIDTGAASPRELTSSMLASERSTVAGTTVRASVDWMKPTRRSPCEMLPLGPAHSMSVAATPQWRSSPLLIILALEILSSMISRDWIIADTDSLIASNSALSSFFILSNSAAVASVSFASSPSSSAIAASSFASFSSAAASFACAASRSACAAFFASSDVASLAFFSAASAAAFAAVAAFCAEEIAPSRELFRPSTSVLRAADDFKASTCDCKLSMSSS